MGFFRNHDNAPSPQGDIHIEDVRQDAPEFKRLYTGKLDERARIKIDCHTFMRSRMFSGELTQPNGRWILFDPEAIADKIIDPLLVPLVQGFVDQALKLDREFLASDPVEFTDENGRRWRRQ